MVSRAALAVQRRPDILRSPAGLPDKARHCRLLLLTTIPVLLLACTADDPPSAPGLLEHRPPSLGPGRKHQARVAMTWVAPRPEVGSGTITSWYKFKARRIDRPKVGSDRAYYVVYLTDDFIPSVGDVCDIVYRYDVVGGLGVDGLIERGRVVTDLKCG